MASKEREELLAEAQGVGLAVGVDFQINISSKNLRTLIDDKKVELDKQLKGDESDTKDKSQNGGESETKTKNVESEKNEGLAPNDNSPSDDIEQTKEQTETYENEMKIKRVSKCGNYKTTITGVKEAARRSGITADEVKECLETGKPAKTGEKFSEV